MNVDTQAIKAHVDLRDLAGRLSTLKSEGKKEYSGPCPKCGGRDRFHVKADSFFCRQCYPLGNGKVHDAIAFVQWAGLARDFLAAVAYLDGGTMPQAAPRAPEKRSDSQWHDSKWQSAAQAEVSAAQQRLLHDAEGEIARSYLAGRAIELEVATAWGLGYGLAYHPTRCEKAPAIVMPWAGKGIVKAVKYRFLDATGGRFTQKPGSERTIYGANMISGTWDTLIAVEGELNAVSIWQALVILCERPHRPELTRTDIVSYGSESATAAAIDLADRYRRVIMWADKAERTRAILSALPRAEGLKSPMIDGQKADANRLLQMGRLPDLLDALL